MSERLWYPQLDVYSCIRRLGGLLLWFEDAPGIERLAIAEFFLANPPLLHKCTMTRATRQAFSELGVARPEKSFLQYPAASLLFNRIEPIQKEALRAMAGKGVISMDALQSGAAELSRIGVDLFRSDAVGSYTESELSLIEFLTRKFAVSADDGVLTLRNRTGLRRLG